MASSEICAVTVGTSVASVRRPGETLQGAVHNSGACAQEIGLTASPGYSGGLDVAAAPWRAPQKSLSSRAGRTVGPLLGKIPGGACPDAAPSSARKRTSLEEFAAMHRAWAIKSTTSENMSCRRLKHREYDAENRVARRFPQRWSAATQSPDLRKMAVAGQ